MKETIELLMQDCVTHRLTDVESIDYIDKRIHHKYTRKTIGVWRKQINSDDSLSQYFDDHTRIGFVRDQRDRMQEMDSVMKLLMKKWLTLTPASDEYRMVRLSDAIVNASKRLEEISLSNPVISAVKAKVDAVGQVIGSSTISQPNYTQ